MIQQLTEEEQEVSYRRRILHGKIDILRAELVNRLRKKHEEGEAVITRRGRPAADRHPRPARAMPGAEDARSRRGRGRALPGMRLHQRRGRELLPEVRRVPGRGRAGQEAGDTTEAYQVDETGELKAVDLEEVAARGGDAGDPLGRRPAGEAFNVTGERMTIGRSPEAEVFLDDVTVSRNHALLVRRRDGLYIDDLGSLNGTYVNRRRIESHQLQNGDELQVGKYKLTYLGRAMTHRRRRPRRRSAAQGEVAHDRRGLQAARARVPGHLDLEDPLPGGPEAALAAAHAGRLPALRGRPTSTACARSCASSATSSCRCA